jgi:hypothetical protein
MRYFFYEEQAMYLKGGPEPCLAACASIHQRAAPVITPLTTRPASVFSQKAYPADIASLLARSLLLLRLFLLKSLLVLVFAPSAFLAIVGHHELSAGARSAVPLVSSPLRQQQNMKVAVLLAAPASHFMMAVFGGTSFVLMISVAPNVRSRLEEGRSVGV